MKKCIFCVMIYLIVCLLFLVLVSIMSFKMASLFSTLLLLVLVLAILLLFLFALIIVSSSHLKELLLEVGIFGIIVRGRRFVLFIRVPIRVVTLVTFRDDRLNLSNL